jgi:hypothetical protein
MISEKTSKNDLYKALGYTTLFVASSIPLGILGIQLLNLVFGAIKV